MTADNQPGHKLRLLYIGRRETTTHRLAHFYLREDNGERWGGVRKPLVPSHKPGAVVELTYTHAGDAWFVTGEHQPVIVSQHQDEPEVLAWQIADRAAYTQDRINTRNRSATREQPDPLLTQLTPVRDGIRRLPAPQRSAAIANILTYLLST